MEVKCCQKLTGWLERYNRECSFTEDGGQLHHLAFAGPIYDNSSKCLILDEPISALDDKTSVEILLN